MSRNRSFLNHRRGGIIGSIFLFLLLSLSVFGQTTGSVAGVVTDEQGAAVVGATVTITNAAVGINQTAMSNTAGDFQFLLLPPGTYTLDAQAMGFRTFRRPGVVVEGNRAQSIPVTLAVGQVTETVEVNGGAVLLEATTSAVGTVMENRKISDLPLNGRNPMGLANLVPSVRGELVFGGPVTKTFRSSQVNIGGGPNISNGFLIDGVPNDKIVDAPGAMTFLTADATLEFKVLTNAFSAEYGRSAGGVISVLSKSGSNEFHGLASEYLRNTKFVANDFFSNSAGVARQPYHVNNWAATLGGPIKKDKLFFFFNYEDYTSRQGFTRIITVPTALQRQGNFSQTFTGSGAPVIIYDPTSTKPNGTGGFVRTPFPNNIIPGNMQSKVAQNYLALMPLPNIPNAPISGINNLSQSGTQPTDRNVEGLKMDYNISQSQRLAVRFTRDDVVWTYPNYFHSILETEGRLTSVPRKSLVLGYTNSLSATLLLDVKAGWNRDNEIAYSPFEQQQYGGSFNLNTLGFPAAFVAQLPKDRLSPKGKLPQVIISDAGTYANDVSDYRAGSAMTGSLAVSKFLGAHTLKAGYQYAFYQDQMGGGGFAASLFNFNRGYTQGPNPLAASSTAGYGTASFLLGDVSPATNAAIVPIQAEQALGQKFSALFFQDDWKVSRKLTFNLGLRWEYEGPITDRFNQFTNFDPSVASPLASNPTLASLNLKGAALFGTGGFTNVSWKHYSPRGGFAYQVNSKLVVRAGYGVMWIPTKGNPVYQNSGWRVANPMIASVDGGLTPFNKLDNPYPNGLLRQTGSTLGASTALGTDLQFTPQNAFPGYSQQWNTTIQYQPWNDWLIEVAYIGNRGVHLMTSQGINYDQIAPQYLSMGSALSQSVPNPFLGIFTSGPLSAATVTRQQLLLPYPQYNSVNGNYAFLGDSIYHAFTVKVEKRFSHGFSTLIAFAGSKLLETAAGNKVDASPIVNWYNLSAQRARAPSDVPQRAVLSALWEVPGAKNMGAIGRQVLSGWHLNSVTTLQSGLPIQLASNGSANFPNAVAGCNPSLPNPTLAKWFNTACFTIPAPFTYGNASPTIPNVSGPGLQAIDASVFRDFAFKERYRLQFRAEAFNLFNKAYFANPGGDVNTASFGVVSSIGNVPPNVSGPGPRNMQFSLRLNF